MTSTVSPGRTRALSTSICQAVRNTIGSEASSASSTPSGAATTLAPGTATYWAWPPQVCSPTIRYSGHRLSSPDRQRTQRPQESPGFTTTRSPSFSRGAPGPSPATTPHDVAPRDVGQRDPQRGKAPAEPQVHVVEGGRPHPHEHLARDRARAPGPRPPP